MDINPYWSFFEVVCNLKALKFQYRGALASFPHFKDAKKILQRNRDIIYDLDIEEFEKDRIWEYLNGDLSPIDIINFFGFWEVDNEENNEFTN